MDGLAVRLFGKFQVQRAGQPLEALNTCKAGELFAYLLLYRGHLHTREVLAGLLWPACSSEQVRKYLRHTLWKLQTVLEPAEAVRGDGILLADADWIGLNPQARLWLDVAEFERACALVQNTPGYELDEPGEQAVRQALDLYAGDLLEGWYQDWCLFERERLQRLYLAMLEKRIDSCIAHGEYETGLDYGASALRYDVAQERIHRRLMRLHYLAGNRTAALRQYERCVSVLRQELGVGPSERTAELYRQICSDDLPGLEQTATKSRVRSPKDKPPALDQTLFHLKELQSTVADVERQLQLAIQTVEAVLNGPR
jgi:DNA-binding SARP family transcriptional activator